MCYWIPQCLKGKECDALALPVERMRTNSIVRQTARVQTLDSVMSVGKGALAPEPTAGSAMHAAGLLKMP